MRSPQLALLACAALLLSAAQAAPLGRKVLQSGTGESSPWGDTPGGRRQAAGGALAVTPVDPLRKSGPPSSPAPAGAITSEDAARIKAVWTWDPAQGDDSLSLTLLNAAAAEQMGADGRFDSEEAFEAATNASAILQLEWQNMNITAEQAATADWHVVVSSAGRRRAAAPETTATAGWLGASRPALPRPLETRATAGCGRAARVGPVGGRPHIC